MTSHASTSRWRVAGLGLALCVLAAAGSVRGDEPVASDDQGRRGHELRIFDVSSLTLGFDSYGGEVSPRAEIAEPNAAGGREWLEADFGTGRWNIGRFGSIDDVLELIRAAHAKALAEEGVRVAEFGRDRLLFVGPRSLADGIAATLDALERSMVRPVSIDVLALRGDASRVMDGDVGASIARSDLVALAGARAVGTGGAVSTFVGGYDAFVASEDAEVTWRAKSFDPVVGIARSGLSVHARLNAVREGHVYADLMLWWARPEAPVRSEVGATRDPIETLETETRTFDGHVDLVAGAWRLLPSTGDVVFAVRVALTPEAPRASLADPLATTDPIAAEGSVELRDRTVSDFGAHVWSQRGVDWWLTPSGTMRGGNDERLVLEPECRADWLPEVVRAGADPASWAVAGREIDLRNGTLYVRTDEAHDRAVGALLDRWRRASLRSTRLRATDVTLPLASIPEYLAGLGDGAAILRDGVRGLLVRPGAHVVGKAALTLRDGQRLDAVGGVWRTYVADFDPELCEASQIGNPIVRLAFEGTVLDARVLPRIDGSDALVDVAWTRCTWRGSRKVPTSMGEIECPSLGISRIRGGAVIPRGAARVVGAALERGEVTLTILEVSP